MGASPSLLHRVTRNLTLCYAATVLLGCAQPQGEPLADGGLADLSAGHWQVINYWAEWCAPCRHEIPELNELNGTQLDLPVVVLGVNYDGLVGDKLTTLIKRMGIEFDVLVQDPRQRWAQPLPDVLPTTFIIGPDGQLKEALVGPQTRAGILGRIETHSAAYAG